MRRPIAGGEADRRHPFRSESQYSIPREALLVTAADGMHNGLCIAADARCHGEGVLASLAEEGTMAAISVRGLDDDVRERLRVRAARNGRSMEAEIREILTTAVSESEPSADLFSLRKRFGDAGGVELSIPPRTSPARPADFSE